MTYIDVDYNELHERGKILGNPYQEGKDIHMAPILLDGYVYKPFLNGAKKKEKLIELLKKLNWEYLASIIGIYHDHRGYVYEYNANNLLKDALKSYVEFDRRLEYMDQILRTDEFLVDKGLTFFDYHSANILVGKSICLLDEDSIISANSNNRRRIKEYLLELMISIFINYDLTFNGDNSCYYGLLVKFFNDPTLVDRYDIDLRNLFDKMTKKTSGEIEELKEEIIRL
ncbi:MAG: hypothetical protein NC483_02490 [Ruminococcus sp.]|nr:hypothetical protein [Ruminococcus sp.]